MKRNRFDVINKDKWVGGVKYSLECHKHLNSYRLLKQSSYTYDSREPSVRSKSLQSLHYLIWYETPRRFYSKGWKYRSRFPNQYERGRKK